MIRLDKQATLLLFLTYCPVLYYFGATFYSNAYLAAFGTGLLLVGGYVMLEYMQSGEVISTKNKAVFITGCDSGFGNMLARKLDKAGVTVFAGCLQRDSLGARELERECSDKLCLVEVDVTSTEQVQQAAKKVKDNLGDNVLWGIASNAGISCVAEVELCPISAYEKLMDVNTFGAIRVIQALLPLIRECNGRIVIVASLSGRYTIPAYTAYSMSKSALISFTDGLRREMAKFNVCVSMIEPTLYKTPITAEEAITRASKKLWDQSPKTIKSDYGDEPYINKMLDNVTKQIAARARNDPTEVVNAIYHGILSPQPKDRYIPCWKVGLRARILATLPYFLQDKVMAAYQPRECSQKD